MSSLEYLEEERKKIWAKILLLEESLEKKTSDYEKDAKQASKKTSEFRNRSEEAKNETYGYLRKVDEAKKQVQAVLEEIKGRQGSIDTIYQDIEQKQVKVTETSIALDGQLARLTTKISQLEEVFEKHPDIDSEITKLESIFSQGTELRSKINATHKSCLSKKTEIDELYYNIVGYAETEEGKEDTYVEGLKDKLEKSFDDLKNELSEYSDKLSEFKDTKETEVKEFIDQWAVEMGNINKKIKSLLPHALTAGLSGAYSDKKVAEEKEINKQEGKFLHAILGLVFISIIPFGVNIALWVDGKSLEELILNMPRMVSAILPLYLPLFWLAYTANKNLNLSKRLVEEYTHKEVLSKTFEGLSTQISEIEDENISSELKIKLIHNILQVSSENPGKLITDYNKADHPLMDALDKSVKLANAVEKLSHIPGLSKITSILERKSKSLIEEQAKKAENALDGLMDRDENDEYEEEQKP